MKIYISLAYRFIPVIVIFLMAVFVTLQLDPFVAAKPAKTTICHIPADTPENYQTLEVSENSVAEHLSDGDCLGECVDSDGDGIFDGCDLCPNNPDPNCTDPCAELAAIDECPCDFNVVPKETSCWQDCTACTAPPNFASCGSPGCGDEGDICYIVQPTNIQNSEMFVQRPPNASPRCGYGRMFPIQQSCDILIPNTLLTESQFATCLCRLAQYANELDQAGIEVSDSGPPFSCEPPSP